MRSRRRGEKRREQRRASRHHAAHAPDVEVHVAGDVAPSVHELRLLDGERARSIKARGELDAVVREPVVAAPLRPVYLPAQGRVGHRLDDEGPRGGRRRRRRRERRRRHGGAAEAVLGRQVLRRQPELVAGERPRPRDELRSAAGGEGGNDGEEGRFRPGEACIGPGGRGPLGGRISRRKTRQSECVLRGQATRRRTSRTPNGLGWDQTPRLIAICPAGLLKLSLPALRFVTSYPFTTTLALLPLVYAEHIATQSFTDASCDAVTGMFPPSARYVGVLVSGVAQRCRLATPAAPAWWPWIQLVVGYAVKMRSLLAVAVAV